MISSKPPILPAYCNDRSIISFDYVSIQILFILLNKIPAHGSAHSLDAPLAEMKSVDAITEIDFLAILVKPPNNLGLNTALLFSSTAMFGELHFRPHFVFSY